jgi:hypothetical protein
MIGYAANDPFRKWTGEAQALFGHGNWLARPIERETAEAFDLSNGVFDRPRRIVSMLVRPGGWFIFYQD